MGMSIDQELEQVTASARAIYEAAMRDGRDLTGTEQRTFEDLTARASLLNQRKQKQDQRNRRLAGIERVLGTITPDEAGAASSRANGSGGYVGTGSPGKAFTGSSAFAQAVAKIGHAGTGPHNFPTVDTGPVPCRIALGPEKKAGELTLGAYPMPPMWFPTPVEALVPPYPPLSVLDVVGHSVTSVDQVSFAMRTPTRTITDAATTAASATLTSASQAQFSSFDVSKPVSGAGIPASTTILSVQSATSCTMSANATATASAVTVTVGGYLDASASVAELGTKPLSIINFQMVTRPVSTYAHYVAVTKQALADRAGIEQVIQTFLLTGVRAQLERAVTADIVNNAQPITVTGTEVFAQTREALLAMQKLGVHPTAWVVSPEDNAGIELLKDSYARFYGAGPFGLGPASLWGLPRVVAYYGLNKGTVILGDMSVEVVFDRMQAAISATDSHADWFVKNLVAILAELRAAVGCLEPVGSGRSRSPVRPCCSAPRPRQQLVPLPSRRPQRRGRPRPSGSAFSVSGRPPRWVNTSRRRPLCCFLRKQEKGRRRRPVMARGSNITSRRLLGTGVGGLRHLRQLFVRL
jgi:hypothetical protein